MMDQDIVCQGCGVTIQTENKDELGYTPQSALSREEILCQRCFRLKHYNETEDVQMTDDDFFEMVSSLQHTDGLIVYIVDLFDVTGSIIYNLPRIIGNKPIILVGNKLDLLPKSTNHRKIDHWLRRTANESGISVTDVFLISSTKGHGIRHLTEAIEKYRKGRDVYVVGVTNVGKSTMINHLIEQTTGHKEVITTSYFPGTTLGFIQIPLDDHSNMIDTPGIVNDKQMAHYVSNNDLKKITPRKEIKSRNYQLDAGQTLFFGGLARLDFVKGDRQTFTCYFSNELPIHRTKLIQADELYERQCGKMLVPPDEETASKLPELVATSYRIESEKTDIVFPGLGWVTVTTDDITVVAHSPKDVPISLRESLI
ncbi:MAG TPA: ribosome biogenesis GTPase YqeH [Bacillota bacterium]|nr:ribosome biogenesis GTPase YqeH [Bacillota bacterium]